MKTKTVIILLLTLFTLSKQYPLQNDETAVQLSAPAREIQERFDEANQIELSDYEAMANLYTDDCKLLYTGVDVVEGREGLIKLLKFMVEEAGFTKIINELVQVGPMGENYTFGWGTYEAYRRDAPDTVAEYGKFFHVYKKVDGEWKIYIESANASPYKVPELPEIAPTEAESGVVESAQGPCNPNPCVNGGECYVRFRFFYKCECPQGFDGKQCEFEEPEPTRDCPTACIFLYLPVCGSDGTTYSNECEMNKASCEQEDEITIAYTGECTEPGPDVFECPEFCTSLYDPVCGSNGVTYGNECELTKAACLDGIDVMEEFKGRCEDGTEPASECPEFCMSFYDPVCGSDDVTYNNDCEMKKAACLAETNITEAWRGSCEAKPSKLTKCQTERREAGGLLGAYIPSCTEAGEYEIKQCHGSTGYCWCVNAIGEEREGTRRGPVEEEIICELAVPLCVDNGLKYKDGDVFQPKDSCVSCTCIEGNIVCPTVDCYFPANPLCVDKGTPEGECCPVFECPEGCADSEGQTYEVGAEWKHEPCIDCQCVDTPEGPTAECFQIYCDAPPPYCTIDPVQEPDACCPSFTCPEESILEPVLIEECPFCTSLYDPVCGSNGVTYGNECELNKAACEEVIDITVATQGRCEDAPEKILPNECPEFCTWLLDPVCGSNGVIYDNECEMNKAACEGEIEILLAPPEVCEEAEATVPDLCDIKCNRMYRPVCGSDGTTYSNECMMGFEACQQNIEVTKAYDGPCAPEPEPRVGHVGECPPPGEDSGFGICANVCEDDSVCGETERCCPTACGGTSCMETIQVQPVPPTLPSVPRVGHVGECPPPGEDSGFGICANVCEDDNVCGETERCCPTACGGTSCMETIQVQPPVLPDCPEICPFLYAPVCGSNGVTYDNACLMSVAACEEGIEITLAPPEACAPEPRVGHVGECPPPGEDIGFGICANVCEDDSVCGGSEKCCPTACGGTSCMEAVQIQPPRLPECPEFCGEIYDLACGSNGVIYDNECEMNKAACKEGIEILLAPPEVCAPPVELTKCQRERKEEAGLVGAFIGGLLGAYVPSCTDAGEYEPKQCHGSTGYCWCVDVEGKELEGTRRGPVEDRVLCVVEPRNIGECPAPVEETEFGICSNLCADDSVCGETEKCCPTACGGTSCMEAVQIQPPVLPVCTSDGVEYKEGDSFRPKGNCVDCYCSYGEIVCPVVDCFPPENPLCIDKGTPEGECCPVYECPEAPYCPEFCTSLYDPVCGNNGVTYGNECELNKAACEEGLEVIIATVGRCEDAPEPTTGITKCQAAQDEAGGLFGGFIGGLLGADIPSCTDSGEYEPKQCSGSTGHCWCVDVNGEEREGTRRGPGEGEVLCLVEPGCIDYDGQERAAGSSWKQDKCTSCQCFKGFPACVSPSCAGPPHPDCLVIETDECCPSFDCSNLGYVDECPAPAEDSGFGICANVCEDDSVCSETEKCCPTACGGTSCMQTVQVLPPPELPTECTYFCTEDYTPVCGSDGTTYSNECEMGRAACEQDVEITKISEGECAPEPRGVEELKDHCIDSDQNRRKVGESYLCADGCNRCVCREIIEISTRMICPEPEPTYPVLGKCTYICTQEYIPVCGSDGTTHSNECEMGIAACEQDVEITKISDGECVPEPRVVGELKDHCIDSDQNKRKVGESYLCADGCNQCTCGEIAEAGTIKLCPEPEPTFPVIGECTYFCTEDYTPVCGSDGTTHSNECEMGRAACEQDVEITKISEGECVPEPRVVGKCTYFCDQDYTPVCGSDGTTHSNECEMGRAACEQDVEITLAYYGECLPEPEPTYPKLGECTYFCTEDYTPVCGSDGTTYSNECDMGRTACEQDVEITKISEGECPSEQECPLICTADYNPVCGSDGNTYSNECELRTVACNNNVEITVVSEGECPPEPIVEAFADCEDDMGNLRSHGERWEQPCGTCVCQDGYQMCPTASCSGPPSPLCTSTFDPEVDCCPQYSCPEGKHGATHIHTPHNTISYILQPHVLGLLAHSVQALLIQK
ncbi:uncharacterized protein [Amphiura filiformis]|uniref:uncharacterized protein isoform X4 n=1 Tax=Amphiura filiformis TaxID=82378 RepID=UPI003B218069